MRKLISKRQLRNVFVLARMLHDASIWQAGRVAGVQLVASCFWVCVFLSIFLRVPFSWGGFKGKPRGETVEMGVPLF